MSLTKLPLCYAHSLCRTQPSRPVPFPLHTTLSLPLCPGTAAGELIVGVPLSVSSPVQTVKHMGFGGPEDLRVLVEGRLEEGKRESNIVPMCAERQEPQRGPGTERPLFPGEIVWEVSTVLGTVWIGRPGPSLARALPP